MSLRLSNALIRLAEQTLLDLDPAMAQDPSALVPIARTPFFLGRMELIRTREDFLLLGVIKHPVTQEDFGIGHPSKRAMR
jgi:hypothetical protein